MDFHGKTLVYLKENRLYGLLDGLDLLLSQFNFVPTTVVANPVMIVAYGPSKMAIKYKDRPHDTVDIKCIAAKLHPIDTSTVVVLQDTHICLYKNGTMSTIKLKPLVDPDMTHCQLYILDHWIYILRQNGQVERVAWLPKGPLPIQVKQNALLDMVYEHDQWKRRYPSTLLDVEESDNPTDIHVHSLSHNTHLLLKGHQNGHIHIYLISNLVYFIEQVELNGPIAFKGFHVHANELYYLQPSYLNQSTIDTESGSTIIHRITPYTVQHVAVGENQVAVKTDQVLLLPRFNMATQAQFVETGAPKCILEDGFLASQLIQQLPMSDNGPVEVNWSQLTVNQETLLRLNELTKGLREQVSVLRDVEDSINERVKLQQQTSEAQKRQLVDLHNRVDMMEAKDAYLVEQSKRLMHQHYSMLKQVQRLIATKQFLEGKEVDRALLKRSHEILKSKMVYSTNVGARDSPRGAIDQVARCLASDVQAYHAIKV